MTTPEATVQRPSTVTDGATALDRGECADGVESPESQASPPSHTRKRSLAKQATPRLVAHYDASARELEWTWTRPKT